MGRKESVWAVELTSRRAVHLEEIHHSQSP